MKAVIFDLGRVLIDYEHLTTVSAIADQCQAGPEAVAAFMRDTSETFGLGMLSAERFHQRLIEELGYTDDFPAFIDRFAAGIQRNEEALAYALSLQQRPELTVAIISNTNEAHVLWLDEHLPELTQFDLVMMSNEVAILKPDTAIFELAMELLSVLPEQCIFVDDLAENVAGARTLDVAGIVHNDWSVTRPQLETWLSE